MGRIYAGILGPLAFFTVTARGLLRSQGFESTVWTAAVSLGVFALVGFACGELAAWIVSDAVRAQVAAEIAALEESNRTTAVKTR